MPKRKPQALNKPGEKPKPLGQPKKFAPFSARDSRSIESAFQRLAEEEDTGGAQETDTGDLSEVQLSQSIDASQIGTKNNTSINNASKEEHGGHVKIPVNEDFLFDVDIDNRELAPAYWLGPIYEVRRASWFYQDGSSSRPCDENLSTQLEEGYIKIKPWQYELANPARSSLPSRQRPASWKPVQTVGQLGATNIKPPRVPSVDDTKNRKKEETSPSTPGKSQLQTHRLFGTYMNSVVTYQDSTVAWLATDDFLSRMSSSVYQRFAGGGHLGGVKVVRGFVETGHKKDSRLEVNSSVERDGLEERGRSLNNPKRRSAPPSVDREISITIDKTKESEPEIESKQSQLERRMATIVGSPGLDGSATPEEEMRKREQAEIQEDYTEADGDEQGREIEHLWFVTRENSLLATQPMLKAHSFVTHGIGQRLGLKMESLNFIHDVNVLRKTLKSVYDGSQDLQALNSEVDRLPKNCRIQVLPIVWRHLLDFPKQSFKRNGKEQDLSDVDAFGDDLGYPKLNDITVDGVPAIRNLVEDLFLDILLYQSAYREHIAGIVQRECNRVYDLFKLRNPQFKGKVSLVGHSLGSAIMFDLLCRQKEVGRSSVVQQSKQNTRRTASLKQNDGHKDLSLDFEVEDFYCLGSPIGLFQMIKGRTIAGRRAPDNVVTESPLDPRPSMHDSYAQKSSPDALLPSTSVSSPKCAQVFNIFHPTDPIAYRIEPLISPAMKALKPQPLPYIKKGIFGVPGAGLTGIGARVGQSVSGLWSNITTGVASSLLNRSLGLTHDPQHAPSLTRQPLSMGAGANALGGGATTGAESVNEERKNILPGSESGASVIPEHPATLIDNEIETLYSGFQRRRKNTYLDESVDPGNDSEWQEAEERAKQYRREEAKVRALNSNGRVDYSIQESVHSPIQG